MLKHLYIASICLVLFSCKKEEEPMDFEFGYEYAMSGEGQYIIYDVDSIQYGSSDSDFSFQIKEIVAGQFVDATGVHSDIIERYKRNTSQDEWQLIDTWYQYLSTSRFERVEDNVRFIRLVFPVEEGKTWDGNAYNTLGDWNYTYREVGQSKTIGGQTFDSTLVVDQQNISNLVEQRIKNEVYAKNVGMIKKQYKDVSLQNGEIVGVEITMTLSEYGVE